MTKKLTITVSDEVYEGLHRRIGPRRISRFIDELARRHVLEKPETFRGSLADAYRAMAADEEAEREAHDWTESLIGETMPDEDFSDWPGYPSR
jgi:predicted CopG family antitoxin